MADIKAIVESVENFLVKNNTTTATIDISSGLNKRVVSFYKGVEGISEKIPVPNNLYPAIFVELNADTEEIRLMSQRVKGQRDIELDMAIVTVVNYGIGTGDNVENSDLESITLTQNIKDLIRSDITLSGTIQIFEVPSTDYSIQVGDTDTYNSVSRIQCNVKIFNRT